MTWTLTIDPWRAGVLVGAVLMVVGWLAVDDEGDHPAARTGLVIGFLLLWNIVLWWPPNEFPKVAWML